MFLREAIRRASCTCWIVAQSQSLSAWESPRRYVPLRALQKSTVGLIFIIPGKGETLRVSGNAPAFRVTHGSGNVWRRQIVCQTSRWWCRRRKLSCRVHKL